MYNTQTDVDDDNIKIIASNTTTAVKSRRKSTNASPSQSVPQKTMAATARALFGAPGQNCLQKMSHSIMDTGATAIFIMEGTPVENKRIATKPLTINLPDGTKIKLLHCCDITIPGLPVILTGHIVPSLLIASLIGVRVLCDAGCTVTCCKDHCDIICNDKTVLKGCKDPTTNLWTIPINSKHATHKIDPALPDTVQHTTHSAHSISTRANKVKFAHQSLCNPKISTLLKAMRKGFLKGCPNISEKLILKYLNPSPATAKGQMKLSRQGIHSTTPKNKSLPQQENSPVNQQDLPLPIQDWTRYQNVIPNDSEASIANVFLFRYIRRQEDLSYLQWHDRQFPICLIGRERMLLHHVPLWIQQHARHTNHRPNEHHNIQRLQATIRNARNKGVQSKDERNGQPGNKAHQKVPHQKGMWYTTRLTEQQTIERCQTSHPNLERCTYQCIRNHGC